MHGGRRARAVVGVRVQNGPMSADLDELRRLRRARDRMDREYAQPLDVASLARTALMSAAHFSRRFRAAYSETPYSYLMTRRIERAKALLRRGDLSVTEVCFAVGCTSLGSFSARFTELVGETPSAYRARDHEELRVMPTCQTMVLTRPRKGGSQERREPSPVTTSVGVDAAADSAETTGPETTGPEVNGPEGNGPQDGGLEASSFREASVPAPA